MTPGRDLLNQVSPPGFLLRDDEECRPAVACPQNIQKLRRDLRIRAVIVGQINSMARRVSAKDSFRIDDPSQNAGIFPG